MDPDGHWLGTNVIKVVIAGTVCLIILAVVVYFVNESLQWYGNAHSIAREECEKFVDFACQYTTQKIYQNESNPIRGGKNSTSEELPHMAYVEIESSTEISVCGGSLISEYFVLTAAHCVSDYVKDGFTGKVKLGSVTSNLADGTGEVFDVAEFYIHYGFIDYQHKINDMLLLKLAKEVKFSSTIRPICLNVEYTPERYKNVTTAGWGRTELGNTEYLKITSLSVNEGPIKYKCELSKIGNFDDANMICAGYPRKWHSPQPGDSGGPLQIPLGNKCANRYVYELIGVTSSVQNRVVTPDSTVLSLFTKVHRHIPWIVSIVWR